MSNNLRPETMERITNFALANAFIEEQIREIVKLQVKDFARRLADQNLTLDIDGKAMAVLAKDGYDPAFGARPVKRAIQRDLENPIAKAIVAGTYPPGATITATAKGGEIVLG